MCFVPIYIIFPLYLHQSNEPFVNYKIQIFPSILNGRKHFPSVGCVHMANQTAIAA